jgi:hypothetical protein
VPWQQFSTSHVLRNGLYSLRLLSDGTVNLQWDDTTAYWSRGTLSSSNNRPLTSPTLELQSTGILSVLDPTLTSRGAIIAYSNDYNQGSDILRFLRLDGDGNLRMYGSARGSGIQTVIWVAVEDQCRVFGYCGNMGICSYSGKNPICRCPSQNFELVDPKDSRKGCKRKVETQDCPGNLTMLTMEHTLFLTFPPQSIFAVEGSEVFFVAISSCRMSCLISPICDASTILSDGMGMCYYKKPGFISGYSNPALPSTSYFKVCSPAVPNASPSMRSDGWRMHSWAVALVVIGTVLGLIALEVSLWWWCCRSSPKFGGLSAKYALLEYASCAPVQFSYKELRLLTKGFEEKLGTGGIGAVYRGILADKTVVAVKRLDGIEEGERQFRMAVSTISCTHHLNLVRLIGFCCERSHRLVVYEFMQNRSLDKFLFRTDHPGRLLNWESRFKIALGTARGITYLHDECPDCIVHCDIKPENILLDENFSAKVSDFGLAKLKTLKDRTDYLAPEWLQANLPMTSKSDVYSYGMVLLEIVSGKRHMEVSAETNWKMLSGWAYKEFEKGNVMGIVDRRLAQTQARQGVDVEQVMRAIQVSFWCIQEPPSQRPRMGEVVHMLEGITEIHRPPHPKGRPSTLC